ncbi:MAG TPA: hypothetical protein VIM87_19140 [Chitinophaga sp.]|uniref:hypothetical protein n=1 Tax=Chitinophaga sp. TaxID=1869181 RepID=UPI002F930D90
MEFISPWTVAALEIFSHSGYKEIYQREGDHYTFSVFCIRETLWIQVQWKGGARIAFRAVYAPLDEIALQKTNKTDDAVTFDLRSASGDFTVALNFYPDNDRCFRCTTSFTPAIPLHLHASPRDIIPLKASGTKGCAEGEVYVTQFSARSGLVYFGVKEPSSGSVLYLQNLTALSDYCEATQTSVADSVGGGWPEIGFQLPPTTSGKPLAEGRAYVISDFFIALNNTVSDDEAVKAKQFIDLLSDIYLHLPKPATRYHNWLKILEKSWHDLEHSAGPWTQVNGKPYLNAYVCDYKTPPEVMVQLAVLLPLIDYQEWSGRHMQIVPEIAEGIPNFYEPEVGTLQRWLPAVSDGLDRKEEHKVPGVMDSWYLHHPLMNLLRLLKRGHEELRGIMLASLDFSIKVAHHFNYRWPVFYKMDTLEVVKGETAPGKGGEQDVAGIYAKVMLLAWEYTNDEKYLQEAMTAIRSLKGKGFKLLYQANNTAFSAYSAIKLYKHTGEEDFLNIAYLCIANILNHVWLWECNYGYAKAYPTFFALFPLNTAPYTAVYEETEVVSTLLDFLQMSEDVEQIAPSVRLLLAELIRYYVYRAAYYYPPMLPREVLTKEVKTGEIAPDMWIPLEDLQEGWKQSGTVGQEVYGAGLPFALVPRHYHIQKDMQLSIFIDYPTMDFNSSGSAVTFKTMGDERLCCDMRIMPLDNASIPDGLTVTCNGKKLNSSLSENGAIIYKVPGNQQVVIS